jgi:hypothetical protein
MKSPPDPIITAKSVTRQTSINGMKEVSTSIRTEIVAEVPAGLRGTLAGDSMV